MRSWLAAAAGATLLIVLAGGATAQAPHEAPRLTGTDHPNLNGLWEALTEANWDIQAHAAKPGPPEYGALYAEPAGTGIVEGNEIPYQPWALAKKKENFEKRLTRVNTDGVRLEPLDPEAKCYMPGVPRANYMPFPFQIIEGDKKMIIAYEYASASRIINLEKPEPAPVESYMGWSNGRWEGDTLVVDVTNFVDTSWFGEDGYFHSDKMHVIERLWREGENLAYQVRVEDPVVLAAPWTEPPHLIRPSNDPLEESPRCVETDGNKLTNLDHHGQR